MVYFLNTRLLSVSHALKESSFHRNFLFRSSDLVRYNIFNFVYHLSFCFLRRLRTQRFLHGCVGESLAVQGAFSLYQLELKACLNNVLIGLIVESRYLYLP